MQVVTNPADDEMQVFRDQYLRVTMMDADGNNRVGGEDSDLFNLEWFGGPSTEPRARHCSTSAILLCYVPS